MILVTIKKSYQRALVKTFKSIMVWIVLLALLWKLPMFLGLMIVIPIFLVVIPFFHMLISAVAFLVDVNEAFAEDNIPPPDPGRIEVLQLGNGLALYPCGHTAAAKYQLVMFGRTGKVTISEEFCPDCAVEIIAESSFQCSWCGERVFAGEAVRLKEVQAPFGEPITVAYCMRPLCCPQREILEVGIWDGTKAILVDSPENYQKPFIANDAVVIVQA